MMNQEILNFIKEQLIMDNLQSRVYFLIEVAKEGESGKSIYADIISYIDDFWSLFSEPIIKAKENNTLIMDEIRAFDPENKLGYNNLIV